MRDVRDMDLQMPAAIGAVLDAYSIVKIACGLAVNGDDGEMAKIFASLSIRITHRLCAKLRFFQNFSGKCMWQVVFEDFNDAARGWCTSARISHQLDVHNGPIKLVQARDASSPNACFIG